MRDCINIRVTNSREENVGVISKLLKNKILNIIAINMSCYMELLLSLKKVREYR